MTSAVDICNRALSEMGARTVISSLSETSAAAVQCSLFYSTLRRQLLRAAPWGFARKTEALTTLGLLSDDPPASPFPWLAKYLYPADCVKLRYILPSMQVSTSTPISIPTVGVPVWAGNGAPSRSWRFIVASDDSVVPSRTVLLANIDSAIAVYTKDETDPERFDDLFQNALSMALANKLCMPLSGNVALKQGFAQMAEAAITQARAADGNEALASTDHIVDWMVFRNSEVSGTNGYAALGNWFGGYDNMSWGM